MFLNNPEMSLSHQVPSSHTTIRFIALQRKTLKKNITQLFIKTPKTQNLRTPRTLVISSVRASQIRRKRL